MGSCSCDVCVNMCRTRPCWPTPEQAAALMDAGYARRLSAVQVIAYTERGSRITALVPAVSGKEGMVQDDLGAVGQCTFLDNGLCELHDKGLKPLEGQVLMHDKISDAPRLKIMEQWKSSAGDKLLWR